MKRIHGYCCLASNSLNDEARMTNDETDGGRSSVPSDEKRDELRVSNEPNNR